MNNTRGRQNSQRTGYGQRQNQKQDAQNKETVLEIQGLSKKFGDFQAVENLDLQVFQGETFGFLGPNGAGKTTTIRTVLGLLKPTEGSTEVFNVDSTSSSFTGVKEEIGYLPAELQLDETLTCREHINYHRSLKSDELAQDLITYFDVPLDKRFKDLSSGNRRKLGLVLTFMHDPDLVILDEPTTGLDPLLQQKLIDFLKYEEGQNKTIFLSSHRLPLVKKICDRAGILRDGNLVRVEEIESLTEKSGKQVQIFAKNDLNAQNLNMEGVRELNVNGQQAQFMYTSDQNQLLQLLNSFSLLDVEIEEAPLEKIFMSYYGDENNA